MKIDWQRIIWVERFFFLASFRNGQQNSKLNAGSISIRAFGLNNSPRSTVEVLFVRSELFPFISTHIQIKYMAYKRNNTPYSLFITFITHLCPDE